MSRENSKPDCCPGAPLVSVIQYPSHPVTHTLTQGADPPRPLETRQACLKNIWKAWAHKGLQCKLVSLRSQDIKFSDSGEVRVILVTVWLVLDRGVAEFKAQWRSDTCLHSPCICAKLCESIFSLVVVKKICDPWPALAN